MNLPIIATAFLPPFAVLAICMVFLIVTITKLRLHPFIALIATAMMAGLLAGEFTPDTLKRLPFLKIEPANHWTATLDLAMADFGKTAGDIAISIALAAVIGMCLMESGAADKVVRRFLSLFGEKRAGFALLVATYFLSIPIFFDTMFMLMVPIAKALRLRTGKNYLFTIMCVCIAGVLTHSLTVPHPGPVSTVKNLHLDDGMSLWFGIIVGLVPCFAGYFVAKWIGGRFEVPLRETPGSSLADLESISNKPESELPSFLASILPVIVPIALISLGSYYQLRKWDDHAVQFIGNKNVALLVGTAIAFVLIARQKRIGFGGLEKLLGGPLETAGMIILITSAGGAFGAMLRNIGVGEAIGAVAKENNINLILLAWGTAALIRIAQGSATVAMLTTSAIIWDMINPESPKAVALAYSPLYIFLAIGFGAFAASWMNDSGFWIVSRLGGLTEKETLKSWTLLLTICSVIGLIFTLLLSVVLPLAGFGALPPVAGPAGP